MKLASWIKIIIIIIIIIIIAWPKYTDNQHCHDWPDFGDAFFVFLMEMRKVKYKENNYNQETKSADTMFPEKNPKIILFIR